MKKQPWLHLLLLIFLLHVAGCGGARESVPTNSRSDTEQQTGLVRHTARADGASHQAEADLAKADVADSSDEADKDDTQGADTQGAIRDPDTPQEPDELSVIPAPEGAKQLSPTDRVWVDPRRKVVIVDGHVSLREGYLEMFACPAGTKEHESIVAVQARACLVHAGLLAIGAEPGHPVQYQPQFVPPSGAKIEIEVRWPDERGVWRTAPAHDWMALPNKTRQREEAGGTGLEWAVGPDRLPRWWVFAGSRFWTDESTGKQHYMAEDGDLICVSNFSTATLDIPVESSQTNDELLFMAKTERIPPVGTPVRLVLREFRPESCY